MQSASVVRDHGIEGVTLTSGGKVKVETVLTLLNDALATEVLCILRYKRHYFMTAGIRARRAKATFLQHVTEERVHADQLAERIVQLGGKVELSPEQLLILNHTGHIEGESLTEMVAADLLDERIAIASYRDMITTIGPDDPTTQQVLERILEQEEVHAESLARLLRE
jgi:bacterioferritin